MTELEEKQANCPLTTISKMWKKLLIHKLIMA